MNNLDLASALEGHESDFFTLLISSDFVDAEIETVVEIEGVKATIKIQDISYEAVSSEADGDLISIKYTDTEEAGGAVVSVVGKAITVSIESGVTTAEDISDAINESVAASALVVATCDIGDESDPQVTKSETNLTGGVDEILGEDGFDIGAFTGVVGISSDDSSFLETIAATTNHVGFYGTQSTKAKNLFYAFGKMLSNSLNWLNQQYITMPYADDVATLGDANNLFDEKISFVLDDTQFGKKLGLFACGGKAIVGPYIKRNLEIDLQSAALSYISGNQPGYTKKQAALLEDELIKVIDLYISRQWIEAGTIEIELQNDNFVASGFVNISEPKALWRIFGELRQSL